MSPTLNLINNLTDIQKTLNIFNKELSQNFDLVENLSRQTKYWVYDPNTQNFGPSKFVGFKNMNFKDYKFAKEYNSKHSKSKEKIINIFDGKRTREAIEKVLGDFHPDISLLNKLIRWGEKSIRKGIFNGIDKNKWKFVSLKEDEILNQLKKDYEQRLKNITNTERDTLVKQRIGQDALREKLLEVYGNKCAMCDVDQPALLRASHIIPWRIEESLRLEIKNAILLCGLHDLAFENKLITISDDYIINLPINPKGASSVLKTITLSKLRVPSSEKFRPKQEYLKLHRQKE